MASDVYAFACVYYEVKNTFRRTGYIFDHITDVFGRTSVSRDTKRLQRHSRSDAGQKTSLSVIRLVSDPWLGPRIMGSHRIMLD
jgi:hypothetical protein